MSHSYRISFEFFPAKTEQGRKNLIAAQTALLAKNPEFFSCTYGAGGSTRDNTLETIVAMQKVHSDAAPHLSSIGQEKAEIAEILQQYKDEGLTRIVALRGDLPSGMGLGQSDLAYADDLVAFIREETGDHLTLEVAAYTEMHPQARSFADDIAHFKRKIDAGANNGITQYFYNPDAYAFYIDELAKIGCDAPIYPGIMPIMNLANLLRFSKGCGAEVPRWLEARLNDIKDDDEAVIEYGIDTVTRLCERLLAIGAPGLHFYTMNRSEISLRVLDNLGL